jgi:hypothetical protein
MIERGEAQRRVTHRKAFAGADGPGEDGALPNREEADHGGCLGLRSGNPPTRPALRFSALSLRPDVGQCVVETAVGKGPDLKRTMFRTFNLLTLPDWVLKHP